MHVRQLRPALSALLAFGFASLLLSADATAAEDKKVNINQATAEQLANLPRVGTKAAQRIVDHRKDHGPFARIEDLMEVKGFGEKRFEQLKPYLTVSGPTTLEGKVSSAGSRGGRTRSAAKSDSTRGKSKPAASKPAAVPVGQGQ
jgi:competence ComEA-like helix-hairpin-helix protein